MSDSPSPRRRPGADGTGRAPLLLIIVLVYLVFFLAAAGSVFYFFGAEGLPEVRFRGFDLSRFADRVSSLRRSPTEAPRAPVSPSPPEQDAREPSAFRVALKTVWNGISRAVAGAWYRIASGRADQPPAPEVAATDPPAVGQEGRLRTALRNIRWPDLSGLANRTRDRSATAEAGGPTADGQSGSIMAPDAVVSVAQDDLESLKTRLLTSTAEINDVANRLIRIIEAGGMPQAERDRAISGVRERAQDLQANARADYLAQIAAKEREITALRAELASLSGSRTPADPARGSAGALQPVDDTALAELQARHRAEIQRLKAEQAGREAALKRDHQLALNQLQSQYNPVFQAQELREILQEPKLETRKQEARAYREFLAEEGVADETAYTELARQAEDLESLTGRLLEVPYGGSVPDALARIRDAGRILSQGYGDIWTDLADRLETRNQDVQLARAELTESTAQINRVYEATGRLARETRENGYVLDPYDPQNVLLQVSRLHAPKIGDLVYVFYQEDRLVATLLVTSVSNAVRARTLQLADDNRPIRAFDKILLATETNG